LQRGPSEKREYGWIELKTDPDKPVSGFAGLLGKITAIFVAGAALLAAADGFFNQAQSFTCKRIWSGFPPSPVRAG
jgi:hypothetical protein